VILARALEATRRYGDTLALDHINFDVAAGELAGLPGQPGLGGVTDRMDSHTRRIGGIGLSTDEGRRFS
jgi:ABC-type uncharacterized transport system ATPase subunit